MAKSVPVTASILSDPRIIRPGARALRQVTGRVAIPNFNPGSVPNCGWRSWQSSYVPLSAIKVGIWNGWVNGSLAEAGPGGVMTCYLSVEYPRGTFTRLTWSGADHGTIADNAIGYTDLVQLGFTIPAFAWFRINGYQSLSAGNVTLSNWANMCDRGNGDEFGFTTGADHTMDSTVLGSGLVSGFHPQVVLGLSDRPVWGALGDSIVGGLNDIMFCAGGGRGILGRALARLGPHLNYGVPSDKAQTYIASHANRLALMQAGGVSSAIDQLGINDLDAGRTSAQLLADRATIRGYFSGIDVYDTTITPHTTSTDSFKTAANQTPQNASANTQRTAFNDALRNNFASGAAGVIDLAQTVETSTAFENSPTLNGGVWLPGLVSSDGVHPGPKGYETAAREVACLLTARR